jgi:hypothetical protein
VPNLDTEKTPQVGGSDHNQVAAVSVATHRDRATPNRARSVRRDHHPTRATD